MGESGQMGWVVVGCRGKGRGAWRKPTRRLERDGSGARRQFRPKGRGTGELRELKPREAGMVLRGLPFGPKGEGG